MARSGKTGKLFYRLFYKFLTLFLLISLGPLGFIGYYLINLTQESFKKESLRIQKSLAIGFSDAVHNYVSTFKNILVEAARIQDFSAMNTSRQHANFEQLMQLHAAFLELSVFDLRGQELVRLGRFPGRLELRDFSQKRSFMLALREGEYVGELDRFLSSYPVLTVAVQIVNPATTRLSGILMAKLSLNGISSMLKQAFPEQGPSRAAVIGIDPPGFLIAHSDPKQVFRPDAKLPKEILDILLTHDEHQGGGEIILPNQERFLGAFSTVKDLEWVVYVQEPVTVAYQTAQEMKRKISIVFLGMGFLVLLFSFLVSLLITQPIQTLKEAAVKLGRGEFEDLPQLGMPNDEIGELAQTFSQMSDSLKGKTAELVRAKEDVERFNRTLENRVEARTRELRAAQDELIKKEKLAAIGQMASVVSHEIRNPLAVINNSVYFIKTKLSALGDVDPKISKHISIIESEIQQANGIISEILTFARTRELKPELQSLNDFIEELISSYPFPSHIQLVRDLSPENPVVFIDPDEMKQCLRNLIGNGIEVMPNGGILKIVTAVVERGWVCLDVSDTGPGIPPEVLEKIFTPFFTTKARGTGLGLAVVRKVLDRHQGKVEVDTTIGKGTIFKLYLPLAAKPSTVQAPKG
ncbi:MAG: HAMP domain-containing protein [Elusimicrobia bacterium]|nr:HAMP domain-containing protein [Elusimicrobiota bacterium]